MGIINWLPLVADIDTQRCSALVMRCFTSVAGSCMRYFVVDYVYPTLIGWRRRMTASGALCCIKRTHKLPLLMTFLFGYFCLLFSLSPPCFISPPSPNSLPLLSAILPPSLVNLHPHLFSSFPPPLPSSSSSSHLQILCSYYAIHSPALFITSFSMFRKRHRQS